MTWVELCLITRNEHSKCYLWACHDDVHCMFTPETFFHDIKMKKTEKKYEIEALSSLGIRFITEEYIPHKIKNRLWLD